MTEHITPPPTESIKTIIMKGGGVKGLAFAGAIEVLVEHGYEFQTYVGTSAGAIAAVLFASGYPPEEVKNILYKKSFSDFLDANIFKAIYNLLLKGGCFPGTALKTWINELVQDKLNTHSFEDITMESFGHKTGKRIMLFASHLQKGAIVFDSEPGRHKRSGEPLDFAVRLSASIPGVFIPEFTEGYPVYDGALLNNFPVKSYQDARGRVVKDPVTGLINEDFIALYLDDGGDQPERKWWGAQVLNIMLMRDEKPILGEYSNHIVSIRTSPISTTDFYLSDVEKIFLFEAGRYAAIKFLRQPSLQKQKKEIHENLNQLRKKVIDIRKARRRRKQLKTLIPTFLIIIFSVSWFLQNTKVYKVENRPLHEATYVNNDGMIKFINESKTRKEFDEFKTYGENQKQNTRFIFDSVFQVINTGKVNSQKIVVWDGIYDQNNDPVIRIEASSNDQKTMSFVVLIDKANKKDKLLSYFGFEHDKWLPIDTTLLAPEFLSDRIHQSIVLDLSKSKIKTGDHIRVIEVTEYKNLFKPETDVISWFLFAHRGVDQVIGKSTYYFVTDKPSDIDYMLSYYMQSDSTKALYPLTLSSNKLFPSYSDFVSYISPVEYPATNGLLDFLKNIKNISPLSFYQKNDKFTPENLEDKLKEYPDANKVIDNIVQLTEDRYKNYGFENPASLLIRFDSAISNKIDSTTHLIPSDNKLVVFARNVDFIPPVEIETK